MITLELREQDAEPILRKAATEAAKFGAWCDHITRKTGYRPWHSMPFDEARKEWQATFLRAKRIVEAFGIEHEPTSEAETLGVYVPYKVIKSHLVKVAGVTFRHVDKHEPDLKNAIPAYQGSIHEEACRQAAERTVRRWRDTLAVTKAA